MEDKNREVGGREGGRKRECERERNKTIGFRMQVRFSTMQPVGAAALVDALDRRATRGVVACPVAERMLSSSQTQLGNS